MKARVALALVLLAACKSKPSIPLDARPIGQLSPKQLEDEEKRVEAGETVGVLLRAPRIVVGAHDVVVNDQPVLDRSDASMSGDGGVRQIDELQRWMKDLREHWKVTHRGADFKPSAADLTLPADTTFSDGAELVSTIASAGYSNALIVHAGDATARMMYGTHLHLQEDVPDGPDVALVREGGDWKLTQLDEFGELAEFGGSAPPWTSACGPETIVTAATVTSTLGAMCAKTKCSTLVLSGATDAHDAIAILGPALQAQGLVEATVLFSMTRPCAVASSSDGGARPAPVVLGHPTVTGELAPEVVERLARFEIGKFKTCYEDGLKTHPTLKGRVVVGFTIDEQGMAIRAHDDGSDLADKSVVGCIVGQCGSLAFPSPTKGQVVVKLPMTLTPP